MKLEKDYLQIPAPSLDYVEGEEQTIVNETEVNETLGPANDAFSQLNEIGNEILEFVSNYLNQIIGYFL